MRTIFAENFVNRMLNRRILRIKAFKVLYSSVLSGNMSVSEAKTQLELSCEATRDLYIFMLGIVSPLTAVAKERIESARKKLVPTEEDLNPNTRFADNRLAVLLDSDPDFVKIFKKRKFSWDPYDIFLKKVFTSISSKKYYADYMASEESSLAMDCRLFIKIFEEEFVDSPELEQILEDMSIYWNDDLAYSLTYVCRTLKSLVKGERWSLPPLYQSDMKTGPGIESDKAFVTRLLQAAVAGYGRYSAQVAAAVSNWDNERIVSTDMAIIVLGLAEAVEFPGIPVKVTINEYVEISKYYGTPKSRIFVNGLLDRLISAMEQDGTVVKNADICR